MIYLSLVFLLVLGTSLYFTWDKARHRAGTIALARQYGYRHHDTLSLDDFAECAFPPWTILPNWQHRKQLDDVLILDRPEGRIFSFNMFLSVYEDEGEPKTAYRVSMVGMKIRSDNALLRIAAFQGRMRGKNGLHLAMRGDCVYAMFPGWVRRSQLMTYAERVDCMHAMTLLLDGRLEEGKALFETIAGDSPARHLLLLPIVFCGCHYAASLAYELPGIRIGLVIGGGFLLAVTWFTLWRHGAAERELKDYFA